MASNDPTSVSANDPIRILHVDGDSFFASCEIALNPDLKERPVWVGGAQLAFRSLDDRHRNPKAKCPFVPQRGMSLSPCVGDPTF